MITPLSLDIYLHKRQYHLQTNSKKALAEFSYTSAVQGGIRCGDIEAIVIGYKKIRRN
jgi:hypothetical protein